MSEIEIKLYDKTQIIMNVFKMYDGCICDVPLAFENIHEFLCEKYEVNKNESNDTRHVYSDFEF
jgi:hypothetical protein